MEIKIDADNFKDSMDAVFATSNNEALFELKDDRWLVKTNSPSTVLGAAVRVHERNMEVYEKGGTSEVGVKLRHIDDFIRGSTDTLHFWTDGAKLHLEDNEGSHLVMGTIETSAVEGVMKTVPDMEYPVSFSIDEGHIMEFVSRVDSILGTGAFYMEADEEGIWLYADSDGYEAMDTHIPWDSDAVANVDIDWSRGPESDNGHDKEKDKAVTTLISVDWFSSIDAPDETPVFKLGNHSPMMTMYDLSDGDKGHAITYLIAPRIPDDGASTTVPADIKSV